MFKQTLTIGKWLGNVLLVALFVLAGLFGAGYFGLINFYKPYVVLSGSMEPAIKTGSVVFVQQRQFGYMQGDVITYLNSADGPPVTHRIIDLEMDNNVLKYKTQGDANDDPDNGLVDPRNVIGFVGFSIPYLGYLANLAGQPIGFVALVVIPATIIIYEELKTIRREIQKMIAKKQTKDEPAASPPPPKPKKLSLIQQLRQTTSTRNKMLVVGLSFLLLNSFNYGTQANYSDIALAANNFFGAAASYGDDPGGGGGGPEPIELPAECSSLAGQITAIIEGTPEDDDLKGTSANELILGYDGNDKIDGKGGNDCIVGGSGNDKLEGGSGNDVILGGAGEDDIEGGNDRDIIYGGLDNDTIEGGNGDDELFGEDGDDEIEGGAGVDVIRGGPGNDIIEGGSGNDDIRGNEGDDTIEGNSGDDLLSGGDDTDDLDGGSGTDTCLSGETLNSCEL